MLFACDQNIGSLAKRIKTVSWLFICFWSISTGSKWIGIWQTKDWKMILVFIVVKSYYSLYYSWTKEYGILAWTINNQEKKPDCTINDMLLYENFSIKHGIKVKKKKWYLTGKCQSFVKYLPTNNLTLCENMPFEIVIQSKMDFLSNLFSLVSIRDFKVI